MIAVKHANAKAETIKQPIYTNRFATHTQEDGIDTLESDESNVDEADRRDKQFYDQDEIISLNVDVDHRQQVSLAIHTATHPTTSLARSLPFISPKKRNMECENETQSQSSGWSLDKKFITASSQNVSQNLVSECPTGHDLQSDSLYDTVDDETQEHTDLKDLTHCEQIQRLEDDIDDIDDSEAENSDGYVSNSC